MSDPQRYHVSIDQYRSFRRDGFLVVRDLVPPADVAELRQHTDDLMQGRLPEQKDQMGSRDPSKDHGVTCQPLEAPPLHRGARAAVARATRTAAGRCTTEPRSHRRRCD